MSYQNIDIVSIKQRFYNELWPLNRDGPEEKSLALLASILDQRKTINGHVIDFDFILKKYKDYLLKWNYEHGTKSKEDHKFIGKDDKLKNIKDFLYSGKYRDSFEIKRGPRDEYLFRGLTMDELLNLVNRWEKEIYLERRKRKM